MKAIVATTAAFYSISNFELPTIPWQSLIDPAHQRLVEIELNLSLLALLYGKLFRSFLDGVVLCNQRSGTLSRCCDLSPDLSSNLSSICTSRDLI